MFISQDCYTNNVYYIDIEDSAIELWDWAGNRRRYRKELSQRDLGIELYEMMQAGWVKRNSDEFCKEEAAE